MVLLTEKDIMSAEAQNPASLYYYVSTIIMNHSNAILIICLTLSIADKNDSMKQVRIEAV